MKTFRMMVCCTLFSLAVNNSIASPAAINNNGSSEGHCPPPSVTCIILSECEQC